MRLVLIAGPSSSGKTTFSKRLAIQLVAQGLRPVQIEMDNYFVERSRTPRDETGEYDFEHLHALDLPLFHEHLAALLAGQEVQLPHFDFQTGTRGPGKTLRIGAPHVIIAEGIHGMNPELVGDLPQECVYRIYISALTQLNVDHHNRISTTDNRLLRRIVRDVRRYAQLEAPVLIQGETGVGKEVLAELTSTHDVEVLQPPVPKSVKVAIMGL